MPPNMHLNLDATRHSKENLEASTLISELKSQGFIKCLIIHWNNREEPHWPFWGFTISPCLEYFDGEYRYSYNGLVEIRSFLDRHLDGKQDE